MYNLIISKKVTSYVKKLQSDMKKKIFLHIKSLQENPFNGKHLNTKNNIELRELKYDVHRIYYYVKKERIQVENIIFEGEVKVEKTSNKNSQKNIINQMKKKMR